MRISDWSSDVCSSDLPWCGAPGARRSAWVEFGQRRGSAIGGRLGPLQRALLIEANIVPSQLKARWKQRAFIFNVFSAKFAIALMQYPPHTPHTQNFHKLPLRIRYFSPIVFPSGNILITTFG